MNKIKLVFTIGDLENLTGISTHTIRIWEKRYKLLCPERTDTNLRRYTSNDLRKLLNIATLQKHGERISRLALLSTHELECQINDLTQHDDALSPSLNGLKVAMLEFDKTKLEQIYQQLSTQFTFRELFQNILVPLLIEIGRLWQTGNLCPAHEHFISNFIRKKIYVQIDKIPENNHVAEDEFTRVVFLPPNEMHELGALYLYYRLLSVGLHAIYLGQSIETTDLQAIRDSISGRIMYISWWTVYPEKAGVAEFFSDFKNKLLKPEDQLWVTGHHFNLSSPPAPDTNIFVFKNPADLFHKLFPENSKE
ncbi:MAG: MerR family transcriptional regulator [Bacteroidia bacterium]|nr:MerR family transcriptional regulator [Bacteroidia bacterium]